VMWCSWVTRWHDSDQALPRTPWAAASTLPPATIDAGYDANDNSTMSITEFNIVPSRFQLVLYQYHSSCCQLIDVLASQSWYEVPFSWECGGGDVERMRPGYHLWSVFCVSLSALTMLVGRELAWKNLCHLSQNLFQNRWLDERRKPRKNWLTQVHHHQQQQQFYGPLSGTTRVSRYQKKHSRTHTYPDHQSSFRMFTKKMAVKQRWQWW